MLAASVALTTAAALILASSARARDEERFRNAVQAADDRIRARINVYIASLRGGVALFAASDTVLESEFRNYVDRLDVQENIPGVQGIGYSERLASSLTGERDERHAVRYLEPLDERNRAAIGFDMYSEAQRRMAMRRARDLGEPAMSGRVRLMQEIYGRAQSGFLIYLPVYASNDVPATVRERRALLAGHVYAAFRADDLFAGIFGSEQFPRVSFTVYDGSPAATAVLHRSPRDARHDPAHTGSTQMQIAGRTWTVVYASQPTFERGSGRTLLPLAVTVGILFSGWVFFLARRLSHERHIAEAASHAKSAFLASMSHELRTPLNAIGGYADLMQLGIPDPVTPTQHEYLARIQRSQQHLLSLINNVLNFAKLESGRLEFRLEPSRVSTVVADAIAMVQPTAEQRALRLEYHAGPDVWIAGDEEKVRQILLNMLSNAVKFTDPGGRVDVLWDADGDDVRLSVRDTGIGIDAADHDRIFEAFVQADGDLTRERQGTGLGLSISRALAQGMGGDITVRSSVDAGSTFTLRLPLAEAPAAAHEREGTIVLDRARAREEASEREAVSPREATSAREATSPREATSAREAASAQEAASARDVSRPKER